MSLHIGDKILEVNGTPVKDTSLENIERLIQDTDKILQVSKYLTYYYYIYYQYLFINYIIYLKLTIEHDPDTIRKSTTCLATKSSSNTSLAGTTASVIPLRNKDTNQRESIGKLSDSKDSNHMSKQEKERLYKRKDEGYISGTKTRQLRKNKNLNLNCSVGM